MLRQIYAKILQIFTYIVKSLFDKHLILSYKSFHQV